MHIIVGVSPYGCSVEAKKQWDPQGISSSNIMVLITDHSHTFLFADPEGSLSKIAIKAYYVKPMGIKVMTQHFCLST